MGALYVAKSSFIAFCRLDDLKAQHKHVSYDKERIGDFDLLLRDLLEYVHGLVDGLKQCGERHKRLHPTFFASFLFFCFSFATSFS